MVSGCVSQEGTTEEAVANIKEAIEVYMESLKDRGVLVPRSWKERWQCELDAQPYLAARWRVPQ